jgi:DNA repair photolyase
VPRSQQPVVRETACKTILNRSSLGGYSLNCYTGCTHGCVYCYARFMQRFHPHDEPWGAFVDVKANAVEVLKRQLRHAVPGEVFMSSACDGWQPIEAKYRLTRRCCELLLDRGFSLHVLTKSGLVLRDLDLFAGHDVSVGVTVTTLDDRLAELWEPGCTGGLSQFSWGLSQFSSDENGTVPLSPIADRWHVIDEARRRGLATSVMFGPLLPFLSDGPREIESLLAAAAAHGVDTIWVDALNPRPRVWPAVAELLRRHFPELRPRYQKILFDHPTRAAHLAELQQRVKGVAAVLAISDRVHVCCAPASEGE